jgi:hypothetical protein
MQLLAQAIMSSRIVVFSMLLSSLTTMSIFEEAKSIIVIFSLFKYYAVFRIPII